MGWNEGFKIFESATIQAYNDGLLNKEYLSILMEPYRGTDIDSGGTQDIFSNDGKYIEQIVVEAWELTMPQKPLETDSEDLWDEYFTNVYLLFKEVTNHFGWK